MALFKVGDFVWAKMTGYPYWPGKVVEEDADIKKPKGKSEMHYVRFYGTGDHAWTKHEFMKSYEENKDILAAANKRSNFIDAVRDIERSVERRSKGLSETSDEEEEESESDGSDDEPLSKRAKNGAKRTPTKETKPNQKKKKQTMKKTSYPSREELNIKLSAARRSPDSTADADSTTQYVQREVMATDKKIGFIGLGIMGSNMAMNLVRTGHHVTIWNRTTDRVSPVLKAGAKLGTSPCDIVQQCDIVFACVSDPIAVRDIVYGNSGILQGMSSGKGFVDMSTIDVDTVKEIAEDVSKCGGRYLEAPINGSKKDAEQGNLVILAAGDRSLYMDSYSCFEAMGKKTFFLGELGNGAKNKLIMSMMAGSFMASLSESLSLAEKAGLDQYTLLEMLNMSSLSCPLVKTKGAAVLEDVTEMDVVEGPHSFRRPCGMCTSECFITTGHFPASFPLKHMQKDLRLAMQIGEELEQPLHIAGSANELFKRAKATNYGDRDMSCVYRVINA